MNFGSLRRSQGYNVLCHTTLGKGWPFCMSCVGSPVPHEGRIVPLWGPPVPYEGRFVPVMCNLCGVPDTSFDRRFVMFAIPQGK